MFGLTIIEVINFHFHRFYKIAKLQRKMVDLLVKPWSTCLGGDEQQHNFRHHDKLMFIHTGQQIAWYSKIIVP